MLLAPVLLKRFVRETMRVRGRLVGRNPVLLQLPLDHHVLRRRHRFSSRHVVQLASLGQTLDRT